MAQHFKSFWKSSQPPDSPSRVDHRCLSCVPGPWLSRMIAHDTWYTTPPTMNGYMKKYSNYNYITTTTTHKFVGVPWSFQGCKNLSLFSQGDVSHAMKSIESPGRGIPKKEFSPSLMKGDRISSSLSRAKIFIFTNFGNIKHVLRLNLQSNHEGHIFKKSGVTSQFRLLVFDS